MAKEICYTMGHRTKNITGQTFNQLTVRSFAYTKTEQAYWNCVCTCGTEKVVRGSSLRDQTTASCSLTCQYLYKAKSHIGERYGKLTITSIADKSLNQSAQYWYSCECDCGAVVIERADIILGNKVWSCSDLCDRIDDAQEYIGQKFGRLTVQAIGKMDYDGHNRLSFKCLCDCGNEIMRAKKDIVAGMVESCGCLYTEYFASLGGESNPNWRGGTSTEAQLARSSAQYWQWVRTVHDNHNRTCIKCKYSAGKRYDKLHAHHILNFSQHPELRYVPANGCTFCAPCHFDFHAKFGRQENNQEQIDYFLAS